MSFSLASKARFVWIGLSRFEAIRSNDKTTRAIFISDTPSLWNLKQTDAHDDTSKRTKARMLRFEPECVNEYGLSRGGPCLRVSHTRTLIADAANLPGCI